MAVLYKGARGKTIGCFEETIGWNYVTGILKHRKPKSFIRTWETQIHVKVHIIWMIIEQILTKNTLWTHKIELKIDYPSKEER